MVETQTPTHDLAVSEIERPTRCADDDSLNGLNAHVLVPATAATSHRNDLAPTVVSSYDTRMAAPTITGKFVAASGGGAPASLVTHGSGVP